MNEETTRSRGLIITIVIIAIIIVAAAIATPIVLRNMEKSNRSDDVKTAQQIADTIIKAASSGGDVVVGTPVTAMPDTVPGMTEQPLSKGKTVGKGEPFIYYYVKQGNSCAIYIGEDRQYNLNNESQAQQYINK